MPPLGGGGKLFRFGAWLLLGAGLFVRAAHRRTAPLLAHCLAGRQALVALVATSPGIAHADDVEYAITAANELGTIDFQTGVFTLLGTAPISSGSNLGNITRMPGGLIYGCTGGIIVGTPSLSIQPTNFNS